jgi:hypothetical protein
MQNVPGEVEHCLGGEFIIFNSVYLEFSSKIYAMPGYHFVRSSLSMFQETSETVFEFTSRFFASLYTMRAVLSLLRQLRTQKVILSPVVLSESAQLVPCTRRMKIEGTCLIHKALREMRGERRRSPIINSVTCVTRSMKSLTAL